jgi:hypothetical protein
VVPLARQERPRAKAGPVIRPRQSDRVGRGLPSLPQRLAVVLPGRGRPVWHVLRVQPGIKIINRPAGLRNLWQQVRQAGHPALREDTRHRPVTESNHSVRPTARWKARGGFAVHGRQAAGERSPAAASVIVAASSAARPACLRAGRRQREQRIREDLAAAAGTPAARWRRSRRAAWPHNRLRSAQARSGAGNRAGRDPRRHGPPAASGPCRGMPRPGN